MQLRRYRRIKLSTVLLFATLVYFFLVPLLPEPAQFVESVAALDREWKVLTASFVVVVLTGLLYILNSSIIRFYQGESWQYSTFGQWLVKRQTQKYNAAVARRAGLRALLREIKTRKKYSRFEDALQEERNRAGEQVNEEFPRSDRWLLPTHLGNVIASFKHYPVRQYQISHSSLWPRLLALVDQRYLSTITEAKASFDFMINGTALSALLAVTLLVAGLLNPSEVASWWGWFLQIVALVGLSYGCYLSAIDQAKAWGNTLKGAFDLYRWALLKQLGYARTPATREDERALWNAITTQAIYGDPPGGALLELVSFYGTTTTLARGTPPTANLRTSRSIKTRKAGTLEISLHVENIDFRKRTVRDVLVTDAPPDSFDYEWGSAWSKGKAIMVRGINPYHFHVGDIPVGQNVLVTYRARSRKTP